VAAQTGTQISLSINGTLVTVAEGATVLDAVNAAGGHVPHLCKDDDQPPIGACRTCLVQVEGQRGYPASCYLPARQDMIVATRGEALDRIRRTVLDLTAAMLAPGGRGASMLSGEMGRYGVEGRYEPSVARPSTSSGRTGMDDSTPAFTLNHADCILCQRCVEGCQDVQHIGAIAVVGGSEVAHIGTFLDQTLLESICTSCGTCVSVCPTGALYPRISTQPAGEAGDRGRARSDGSRESGN
jgi:predicted molibdopterin-dependent oxidoreductase YjgC